MSGDIEKSDGGHIPVVGVPTNDVEPRGQIVGYWYFCVCKIIFCSKSYIKLLLQMGHLI